MWISKAIPMNWILMLNIYTLKLSIKNFFVSEFNSLHFHEPNKIWTKNSSLKNSTSKSLSCTILKAEFWLRITHPGKANDSRSSQPTSTQTHYAPLVTWHRCRELVADDACCSRCNSPETLLTLLLASYVCCFFETQY